MLFVCVFFYLPVCCCFFWYTFLYLSLSLTHCLSVCFWLCLSVWCSIHINIKLCDFYDVLRLQSVRVEREETKSSVPVSQDISEPDESEPFRFILALAAGYFGTIPINPDPSGRIFRNHQDISEPTIRSSALMNF